MLWRSATHRWVGRKNVIQCIAKPCCSQQPLELHAESGTHRRYCHVHCMNGQQTCAIILGGWLPARRGWSPRWRWWAWRASGWRPATQTAASPAPRPSPGGTTCGECLRQGDSTTIAPRARRTQVSDSHHVVLNARGPSPSTQPQVHVARPAWAGGALLPVDSSGHRHPQRGRHHRAHDGEGAGGWGMRADGQACLSPAA